MNGKDLLTTLGDISPKYYQEAESGQLSSTGKKLHRPFLLAAVIAMTTLLVGCGIAYVLKMQNLKVGDWEMTTPVFDENMEFQGYEPMTQQMLTLAGLKGSPNYQASKEWFDFTSSYDPNYTIENSLRGNMPEYPDCYDAYGPYTQDMVDKIDEIAAKYDLKLLGPSAKIHSYKRFYREMGMDSILNPGSKATIDIFSAGGYEGGSWGLYAFFMQMPEEDGNWPYQMLNSLYFNKKDCFNTMLASVGDTGDWREWNYTTKAGHKVLMLTSPSDYGWIFCDRGDAMISVRVENSHNGGYDEESESWVDSVHMTNRQFEQVADAIDFSMQPVYKGEYKPDGSAKVQTQNGYTMELKSVETDGNVAYITLGITAPENIVLMKPELGPYQLDSGNPWHERLSTDSRKAGGGSVKSKLVDDLDGKDNTCDMVISSEYSYSDGSKPFSADTEWYLYFEDLIRDYFDKDNNYQKELLAEGIWGFDIGFENGAFRELELIHQPVSTKACVGFKASGEDVFEDVEITSFTLRSLSATIVGNRENVDFASDSKHQIFVVMQDSSRVELQPGNGSILVAEQPIDLDQVDHVLLPDGTKFSAK